MSKTFDDNLVANYKQASELNNKGRQSEIYYCATSTKGITKRCLDLSSSYVFCVCDDNRDKDKPKGNSIREYRLQACLIKKALENGIYGQLPILTKKWILLDAERNFVKEDISHHGEKRKLDILAFEAETQTYVVLELKVDRDFSTAKKELESYCGAIMDHISKANECYSVNGKSVKGYILWGATPSGRSDPKIANPEQNPWGVIEYDPKFLPKVPQQDSPDINGIEFKVLKEPN